MVLAKMSPRLPSLQSDSNLRISEFHTSAVEICMESNFDNFATFITGKWNSSIKSILWNISDWILKMTEFGPDQSDYREFFLIETVPSHSVLDFTMCTPVGRVGLFIDMSFRTAPFSSIKSQILIHRRGGT